MGLIFLIVLGAALGWLATVVLPHRHALQPQLNVAAGMFGALLAGTLVDPFVGNTTLIGGIYHLESLLVAFAGACLALLCANLLQRSEMR